jgi:5'-3' exonuclease
VKILVVDLSHLFWSIALGGQLKNTNAARDIAINEIRKLAPQYDRVAIACDGQGRSFRAALWPKYKADRPLRPAHLWSLLDDTIAHADAAGWHVFRAPETPDGWYEADDVAATIEEWSAAHGHETDVMSGDSDLAQLVNDRRRTRMLRRHKGVQALDEAGVKAWLGVPAFAVHAFKAIAGDGGDGYGDIFPDVGPKTAIKMLEASGCDPHAAIERVIASEKETAVVKTVRELGPERLHIGLCLATVRRDVPIDVEALSERREAKAPPDEFGDLLPSDGVPDAEFDEDPPPAPSAKDGAQPTGAPVMPGALVRVDQSMKMLAPAAEAYNRLVEFKAFIKQCLTPNVDYGRIPGCDKPVLFKPGAEKLAEIYGLAPEIELVHAVEDWERPLFVYRTKCRLVTKVDRGLIAECIGLCNSRETKYAGRWVYERQVPQHLEIERLKTREFRSKSGDSRGELVRQYRIPNEEIFDQVNTILKMSQKRAVVGAVIMATRSGGIFAQDVEDIPAEAFGRANDTPQWQQ